MKKTFKYYLQFFILFIGLFLSCNTVFAEINDQWFAYGDWGSDTRINNIEITATATRDTTTGSFRVECVQYKRLFIFDTNHNLLKKVICNGIIRENISVDTPIIILGTGYNFPFDNYISDGFDDIKKSPWYSGEVKVRALPYIYMVAPMIKL